MLLRNVAREARDRSKEYLRRYYFHRALMELETLAPTKAPDRDLLKRLWAVWGNLNYSAHHEYLAEVVKRASSASDAVLECGSGLTTILLGLYAGRRGLRVCTLEHDPDWYDRMSAVLKRYHIQGVDLIFAPLENYGEFVWYKIPGGMPKRLGLVVCDGPPQKTTRGDRYGLLPVMGKRLGTGSIILLDDVKAECADPIVSRWLQEKDASCEVFSSRPSDSYAVITIH